MLEVIRQALAANNNVLMARICSAGQKIPNERAIIAFDEIGIVVYGGADGEFYAQPWTSIAWIAVP